MKLQRLLIASAVCAAFAGTTYAQQQDAQQPDPAQQPEAQQPAQQDTMQQGEQQQVKMDEQTIRDVQQKLKEAGHDVGKVDGKWGPKTSNALKEFQQAQGVPATGELDSQTLSALGVEGSGSETLAEQPGAANQAGDDPGARPESGTGSPAATDPGAAGGGAAGTDGGAGAGGGTR
jgi:peptidoglycan hydrolase-like protein with peptidoglycan-binding domain